MQTLNVPALERASGKKSAAETRRAKRIPAIIYGGEQNHNISVVLKDVKKLIYTPDFILAEIEVGGQVYKTFVKDLQFHPVTDEIMHIDFLKLVDGTPVKVEVPVKFEGVSPGVKEGGKLIQQMRRIKIKTTPEKMVDFLTLDISSLELGHAIRVRDIEVPVGVEVMNEGSTPVANVEIPRALKSAATAEAKAAKAEDGEAAPAE